MSVIETWPGGNRVSFTNSDGEWICFETHRCQWAPVVSGWARLRCALRFGDGHQCENLTDHSVIAIGTRIYEVRSEDVGNDQVPVGDAFDHTGNLHRRLEGEGAPLPAHLWPCGCLPNEADEHRGQCPERIRPAGDQRRVTPGELEEIELRAARGQQIPPAEGLALTRTIRALSRRVITRYEEAAAALQRAHDAEQSLTMLAPVQDLGDLSRAVERAELAERKRAAAEDRARRHMATREREEQLHRAAYTGAQEKITELETMVQQQDEHLELAHRRYLKLEAQNTLLQTALDDWQRAAPQIAAAVWSDEVNGAMEYESYPPDQERSWSVLQSAVQRVREALPVLVSQEGELRPRGSWVRGDSDQLRRHLRDRHRNGAADDLSPAELSDQHAYEHAGPGTIRNHDEDDLSVPKEDRE